MKSVEQKVPYIKFDNNENPRDFTLMIPLVKFDIISISNTCATHESMEVFLDKANESLQNLIQGTYNETIKEKAKKYLKNFNKNKIKINNCKHTGHKNLPRSNCRGFKLTPINMRPAEVQRFSPEIVLVKGQPIDFSESNNQIKEIVKNKKSTISKEQFVSKAYEMLKDHEKINITAIITSIFQAHTQLSKEKLIPPLLSNINKSCGTEVFSTDNNGKDKFLWEDNVATTGSIFNRKTSVVSIDINTDIAEKLGIYLSEIQDSYKCNHNMNEDIIREAIENIINLCGFEIKNPTTVDPLEKLYINEGKSDLPNFLIQFLLSIFKIELEDRGVNIIETKPEDMLCLRKHILSEIKKENFKVAEAVYNWYENFLFSKRSTKTLTGTIKKNIIDGAVTKWNRIVEEQFHYDEFYILSSTESGEYEVFDYSLSCSYEFFVKHKLQDEMKFSNIDKIYPHLLFITLFSISLSISLLLPKQFLILVGNGYLGNLPLLNNIPLLQSIIFSFTLSAIPPLTMLWLKIPENNVIDTINNSLKLFLCSWLFIALLINYIPKVIPYLSIIPNNNIFAVVATSSLIIVGLIRTLKVLTQKLTTIEEIQDIEITPESYHINRIDSTNLIQQRFQQRMLDEPTFLNNVLFNENHNQIMYLPETFRMF